MATPAPPVTPPTFVNGVAATANQLNTLSTNEVTLARPPMWTATPLPVASGSSFGGLYNRNLAPAYDPYGLITGSPTGFTVPAAGIWSFTWTIGFSPVTAERVGAFIDVTYLATGVNTTLAASTNYMSFGGSYYQSTAIGAYLDVGDVVWFRSYTTAAGIGLSAMHASGKLDYWV